MKIICIFYIFFPLHYSVFAEETYVYCSDKNKTWAWLSDGKAKVQGKWGYQLLKNGMYYNFFILDKGIDEIHLLKNKCITEFGEDFTYAQPADNGFQRWSLFAVDEVNLVEGIFTLRS